VTVRQRHGDLVVIAQGLNEGERVVVSGQLGVTPGGKVQIASPDSKKDPATASQSGVKS
jgi:multidrug efflux pump subunit AcrA (membrane-fusion protein)